MSCNPGQKIFTTEKEATVWLDSLGDKPVKKKKTPYDDILEKAKGMKREEIRELISELEEIITDKIDSEGLNPLEIALAYEGKAGQTEDYIIGEEYAIRDWIEEHREPNRYETIEYSDILDSILSDYSEDVGWEDLKEEDQEVIQEISDFLKSGCTGFKWDW